MAKNAEIILLLLPRFGVPLKGLLHYRFDLWNPG